MKIERIEYGMLPRQARAFRRAQHAARQPRSVVRVPIIRLATDNGVTVFSVSRMRRESGSDHMTVVFVAIAVFLAGLVFGVLAMAALGIRAE